jgi:SulP family sulfate permease
MSLPEPVAALSSRFSAGLLHRARRFLPFLAWFPAPREQLRADALAGLTVALVLVPQSMAYAQLAGMPAYYGLYAAFLPVMIASLWGSSAQLGTGPVAVVSLLTASSLAPFAAAGSAEFIALAILLSLIIGVIQLLLGAFKLGVIVNFLSHPVIVGFTNAAAIIIGLSQLNKLFGLTLGNSGHFIVDIAVMFASIGETHLPTLAMGIAALALIAGLRRKAPKAPGVLIAVVLTTLVSWAAGFDRSVTLKIERVADPVVRPSLDEFVATEARLGEIALSLTDATRAIAETEAQDGQTAASARIRHQVALLQIEQKSLEGKRRELLRGLRALRFSLAGDTLVLAGTAGVRAADDATWRLRRIVGDEVRLSSGGEVVGRIPDGLPSLRMPSLNFDDFRLLFSAALVISLVGFMEAISIAKALAAKTRQRIDPNQELIGQGLANIVGSFTQSFPVSGSFSRSAVNFNAGARTGMSAVFTGLVVMIVLLFLTPLLYHLPQAVLAAIIIMAVIGLVNFEGIHHAWLANRHDGIAAIVTFVATLGFAPHLDNGILLGAGLAIGLYLYRTMRPRVAILGRHPDGNLRDLAVFPELPRSPSLIVLRFDGRLYFANVPYFEDAVLGAIADNPEARMLLVAGSAINEIDASGEEVLRNLVRRLRSAGVDIVFSGLKKQIHDVLRATHLADDLGESSFFATDDEAIEAIGKRLGEAAVGPLRRRPAAGVQQEDAP